MASEKRALPRTKMLLFSLILISASANGVEVEESSFSINRPIVRDVPDLPGWVRFSTEYVRCFCNFPSCISTGYMCKSSGGGCFSDLLDQVGHHNQPHDVYRGIHGCLELLTDRDQKNWCQNSPGSKSRTTHRKKNHPRSLLLCCYHDMCNHADSPETRVLLNETQLGETANEGEIRASDVGAKQDPALYTESEVWFRAATIAVPICGAVILLALIGLAVKLLRTESSHTSSHKLRMPYMLPPENKSNCEKMHSYNRHHNFIHQSFLSKDAHHHNPIYSTDAEDVRQQTYVPLLIQNEEKHCDKNETNAKLNYMQDLEHCVTVCEDAAIVSGHLFHKNTDLHVGRNMILGGAEERDDPTAEKIYNKESIP